VRLDSNGVEFVSCPGDTISRREVLEERRQTTEVATDAVAALLVGQFALVWNHSAVDSVVRYPFDTSGSVEVWMAGCGVHDFPEFRTMATYFPTEAWEVIASLVTIDGSPRTHDAAGGGRKS